MLRFEYLMSPYIKLLLGLPLFWYPISIVHEAGHYFSSMFGGANHIEIVWRYYVFSETIRDGSKWPLVDVWMGPLVGILIPLVTAFGLRNTKLSFISNWFASISCIGNGLYIGLGWLDIGGDPDEMIRLGTPLAVLIIWGIFSFLLGLILLLKEDVSKNSSLIQKMS